MEHAGHDADLAGVEQEAKIAVSAGVACWLGREGAGTNSTLVLLPVLTFAAHAILCHSAGTALQTAARAISASQRRGLPQMRRSVWEHLRVVLLFPEPGALPCLVAALAGRDRTRS